MRKSYLFATMTALAVTASAAFTSCGNDDETPTATKPAPTHQAEVKATAAHEAIATITPAADATAIGWAYAESTAGAPADFNTLEAGEGKSLTVTIPALDPAKDYTLYTYSETPNGRSELLETDFVVRLVDLRIVNMSAFSLDAEVKMHPGCTKYVIGAFANGGYNEKNFVESAKTSIAPNESYPYQAYNVFDKDELIPESLFSKNRLADDPTSEGMVILFASRETENTPPVKNTYQVAVYALDEKGEGAVTVTDSFEVPEPTFGAQPSVDITAVCDITSVTATYEPEGACHKLIRGFALPYENHDIDWEDPAAVEEGLKYMGPSFPPVLYTGEPLTEKVPKYIDPEWPVVVYAIAIAEDGTLGKLCYKTFTTATPVLDGTGDVNVTFRSATPTSLTFEVSLGNGATGARILTMEPGQLVTLTDDLAWIFSDPTQKAFWTEVSTESLAASEGLVTMDQPFANTIYVVRAVALTPDGKVSPVKEFPDARTLPEATVEELDFSKGRGEVIFTPIEETTYFAPGEWGAPDTWELDLKYTIEKGANTEKVYVFKDNEIYDDPQYFVQSVKGRCATAEDFNSYPEFTEFGVEQSQTSMMDYDSDYGGSGIIVVTKDTDGNFKIAHVYIARPDHSVTTQRGA